MNLRLLIREGAVTTITIDNVTYLAYRRTSYNSHVPALFAPIQGKTTWAVEPKLVIFHDHIFLTGCPARRLRFQREEEFGFPRILALVRFANPSVNNNFN